MTMSYVPKGWTPTSSAIFYDDPRTAIEWLGKAFGFVPRIVVDGPDGSIMHSELVCGDAMIQVATAGGMPGSASPRAVKGAYTQSLYVFVPDIDAHFETARAAGAEIVRELETQHYGDRTYGCLDCEGHPWYFGQRVDDEAWERANAEVGPSK
jgi:uncharacterized glyoxalase superfamily protein PhnB